MNESEQHSSALHRLIAYWNARPYASDTLEGIHSFWVGTQFPQALVLQALGALEAQGLVARATAPDGKVRFRLTDPAPTGLTHLNLFD